MADTPARPLAILFVLSATLPLAACGGGAVDETGPLRPSLRSIQGRVFNRTCGGSNCHLDVIKESGLSHKPGESHRSLVNAPSAQIVGVRLVAPGDPDSSYLMRKLEGRGLVGERMPQGKPPLTREEIGVIREWIRRGAPDD
jgi:hypothetical protein